MWQQTCCPGQVLTWANGACTHRWPFQSGLSGSLCHGGQRSLSPVVLYTWPTRAAVKGCSEPPTASGAALCLPSASSDSSLPQQGEAVTGYRALGSTTLATEALEVHELLYRCPWHLPTRLDLTQAQGRVWHPQLESLNLHV